MRGNRLNFHGDEHYEYDALGNRIGLRKGKNQSQKTQYQYDALNQLVEIRRGANTTAYAYDPLGRRIRKSQGENTVEFLWLGDVLLSETHKQDEQVQQHKTYLFEPNTFKPLAFVQDQKLYHYHLDHLGTPQEITDANGELLWAVSYKGYGNLAVAFKNEVENNLRFQGQYHDPESGLHYNRFRYYDPNCGRFINQDPVGLLGGLNNYLYVPNPTGWVDPYGLTPKEPDCEGSGNGDGKKRRVQGPGDVTLPNENAARREAIRRHGGQVSAPNSYTRVDNWDKNPNLRGPQGQPSEFLDIKDSHGNNVRIDHHKWGHEFKDNNTF